MIIKKHLGQHFLHDENICRKIVKEVQVKQPKNVLEIGSGYGAITKYLIKGNYNIISVDIDEDKMSFLKKNFYSPKITFLKADILALDPPFSSNFSVVGNLPYNIASQIIFKMFEWYKYIDSVYIMVQKEMAERFCSNEGGKNFGFISILLDTFFHRQILFDISPNCFTPRPKVNSSFVRMDSKKEYGCYKHVEAYKRFLKSSFAMRRKTLKNNLQKLYDITKIVDIIQNRRPEEFSTKEYLNLFAKIK